MKNNVVTRRPALALLCASLIIGASATAAIGQQERVEKGNLVIEGIPEIPERVENRLLQYQNTRSAGLADWLPSGGGMLISTRFAETNQIHLVKEPGGARNQITFFDEPISGATVSPDPAIDGFVFGRDVGGSEFYQLFFFDFETGDHIMLTDGQSRNGGALWSNKGDRFVFFTTRRNGQDWDLHVMDMEEPGVSQPVLEEGGTWFAADWSPDDSALLVTRYVSATESYPHILDLSTGTLTRLNPTEEEVAYGSALYSKDGRGIYFTSDQNSEFKRLRYYNLETEDITVLTDHIPWDIEETALSDDGRYLAFTANEDGISVLRVLDTRTMQEMPLPGIPLGVIQGLSFAPDAAVLGLVLETPRSPADVYSIDVAGVKLVRWTFSEIGGLRSESFIVPKLIRYKTFDEVDGGPRTIPAFYYRPKADGRYPVLVDIHGGPEAQAFPDFSPMVQYFVNELGIAVLVPNVRGSSGYGKSYLQLDNDRKREDSVKDIGALLGWIGEQPELDSSRVGVIGGSYGGYMVLAAMARYNDLLSAGIDIVGISNFVTFLENTQDYRRDLRRVEYGDERDPDMRDFLTDISPTANASKITKPLFVAQGLNDPRVPVTESEQMVDVIRKNGGEVWYLLAKDEGHGFRKKTNRDYFRCATVLFLEDYLLNGKGPDSAGE